MDNKKQELPIHSENSEKTKLFECSEMPKKISQHLRGLIESREFSDLILVGSDGIKIPTHRLILCAWTQFFRKSFNTMRHFKKKPFEIEVKEFESCTLELVLQFMYTGSVELDFETSRGVLRAAKCFKIQPLIDLCLQFMEQDLNCTNCLNTMIFAKEHDYMELYKPYFSFVCIHFEEICNGIDFLNLDDQMVDCILSSDEVVVTSEEVVVQSLLMWLEHDRKNREETWKERLSNVRYQFLMPEFIIKNNARLCINLDCHKIVLAWLQWHILPEKREAQASSRKGYRTPKLHLASGSNVQTYYPEFNTWTLNKNESSWKDLSFTRTIVKNGEVYIAGEISNYIESNEIKCFNIETKENWLLPLMKCARILPGLAILNNYLFVLGGVRSDGGQKILTNWVERYDFSDQKWQYAEPMLKHLDGSSRVAVLNDLLYVVTANSTQCYNRNEYVWSLKSRRKNECFNFGLVSCGGYLFAVGGRLQNNQETDLIERYNPLSNTWDTITKLSSPRKLVECVVFNNTFLVVGGEYNSNSVYMVEQYNTETNEWRTLAPLLCKHVASLYIMT